MAKQYRTRNVDIEAIQWVYDGENFKGNDMEIFKFTDSYTYVLNVTSANPKGMYIRINGLHTHVPRNSYIIKHEDGTLSFCSQKDFEARYATLKETLAEVRNLQDWNDDLMQRLDDTEEELYDINNDVHTENKNLKNTMSGAADFIKSIEKHLHNDVDFGASRHWITKLSEFSNEN